MIKRLRDRFNIGSGTNVDCANLCRQGRTNVDKNNRDNKISLFQGG